MICLLPSENALNSKPSLQSLKQKAMDSELKYVFSQKRSFSSVLLYELFSEKF